MRPAPPARLALLGCGVVLLAWVHTVTVATGNETRLDALVARVDGRMLTLSDVRLARDLGLVPAALSEEAALSRLLDQALMLADLARFQPPDPSAARVDEFVGTLRARVGADAWRAALTRAGVDDEHAWALARDGLRLEDYLRERFGPLAEPTDEDVREAHRAQQAALPPATPPVPFETAAPALRDQLKARRYEALVADWTAELRARGDVWVTTRAAGASR